MPETRFMTAVSQQSVDLLLSLSLLTDLCERVIHNECTSLPRKTYVIPNTYKRGIVTNFL